MKLRTILALILLVILPFLIIYHGAHIAYAGGAGNRQQKSHKLFEGHKGPQVNFEVPSSTTAATPSAMRAWKDNSGYLARFPQPLTSPLSPRHLQIWRYS